MRKKKTVPKKRGTENERDRCCRLLNTRFSEKEKITIEVERPTKEQIKKRRRYIEMIRKMTQEAFGGPDSHVGE